VVVDPNNSFNASKFTLISIIYLLTMNRYQQPNSFSPYIQSKTPTTLIEKDNVKEPTGQLHSA
jgi:hypothetical protein